MISVPAMAEHVDPEFGIRVLGYSRREVDEFLAELRKNLRTDVGGTGEVRLITTSPVGETGSERVLRLATEAADERISEAEQTLRSAREVADQLAAEATDMRTKAAGKALGIVRAAGAESDQIIAEARQRAVELEEHVAAMLEREVAARVSDLARTHNRLVLGLAGMRDALVEVLDRDSDRGPVEVPCAVPTQSGSR
jgi:cell division septum initiation protein DivIVA